MILIRLCRSSILGVGGLMFGGDSLVDGLLFGGFAGLSGFILRLWVSRLFVWAGRGLQYSLVYLNLLVTFAWMFWVFIWFLVLVLSNYFWVC